MTIFRPVTSISTFLILSWLPILVFTLLTLLFDGKKVNPQYHVQDNLTLKTINSGSFLEVLDFHENIFSSFFILPFQYIGIDIAERVAARFYMLSVFSNPFIYCMFNKVLFHPIIFK